jgi:superfamily II DNA or RNA helicase
MKRKHQREFEDIIDGIIEGSGVKIVDIIATPGAGKSSIPIQATKLIKAGLADSILWVVPRSALQDQGERGFLDPFFKQMFNHNSTIRSSTNEFNPCRDTNGFVTTYQAIVADKHDTVLREVNSKRYIIILDEPHHLEKDGLWHNAIDPIVQRATFLIKMTGTLGRGDKKEIAYIDYKKLRPHFRNSEDSRMIMYSRTDALREKAILPIEFHLSDGEFKWKRLNGKVSSIKSFSTARTPKIVTEALYTALNSEFAFDLLGKCVNHWQYIKRKNPLSKLLVVTADYEQAKDVLFALKKSIGLVAEIATSHNSSEAHKAIKQFKENQIECLVTIAMAYEGLDVPNITHICVLTNIRSREWIEQMLARGVRIDRSCGLSYESQKCYVFAPMDRKFKKVVDMIRKQQIAAVENFIKNETVTEDEEGDEDGNEFGLQQVTPIHSEITQTDKFILGEEFNKIEIDLIEKIPVIKTIKEQETELRQEISTHVNRFSRANRYHPRQINCEIKNKFLKSRDLMSLTELNNVFQYIENSYPLKCKKKIKNVTNISVRRGKGRQVTSKIEPFAPHKQVLKQTELF